MDAASASPTADQAPPGGFARLSRDSLVFSLGAFAGKAVALLLVPILTRVLPTEEFGRLDVLSALTSALISVLLLGLDTAAVRQYFQESTDGQRRELISSFVSLLVAASLPVAVVLVLARESISTWLFGSTAYSTPIALVAVAVVTGLLQFAAQTVLRMERHPARYAVVESLSLIGNAALVIVLVYWWQASVTAVMAAYALSNGAAAILGLALIRGRMRARPSVGRSKRLLRASTPLVPALVATWGAEFANRAILLARSGPTEVAYFSIAVRFGSVGVLLASGYLLAWQPHAYERGQSTEAITQLRTEARRIIAVVCSAICMVAVLAPELVSLFAGRQYEAALPAVAWSLVFAALFAAYQVASMPSSLAEAFGDLGMATIVSVAVAIVLNVTLAGSFGAAGTAAALAVGQGTGAIVVGLRGHQRNPVRLPWLAITRWLAVTVAVVAMADLPTAGVSAPVRVVLCLAPIALLISDGSARDLAHYVRRRARAT